MTPIHMTILGGFLLILGFILPFLMVLKVVETTLALSFFAHGASVAGMVLGFYGMFTYVRIDRK